MARTNPQHKREQLERVAKQVTSAAEVTDATPGRRTLRSDPTGTLYTLGIVKRKRAPRVQQIDLSIVHSTPERAPIVRDATTPHIVTCGRLIPPQFRTSSPAVCATPSPIRYPTVDPVDANQTPINSQSSTPEPAQDDSSIELDELRLSTSPPRPVGTPPQTQQQSTRPPTQSHQSTISDTFPTSLTTPTNIPALEFQRRINEKFKRRSQQRVAEATTHDP